MSSTYQSLHTGDEVDQAATNTSIEITQAEFNALEVADMPVGRIYIISDGANANTLWRSDGSSKISLTAAGVTSLGGVTGAVTMGAGMSMNGQALQCDGMSYITEAPTAATSGGGYKVAILESEPTTKYAGWLYYILE